MKTYRIENETNHEVVFGVENQLGNETLAKLNKGLRKIHKPYEHCVPYYKNAKFSFVSLDAFEYFLFGACEFTYEDLHELELMGYKAYEVDLSVYSKGLSKVFCTFFDDEVVERKSVRLTEFYADVDSEEYREIYQPAIAREDIGNCFNSYYKNVKFNY